MPEWSLDWRLIPVACLVILDEWLKTLALEKFPGEASLLHPEIISLAIHKNYGIAFDIPFKREFILLFSLFVGIFLLRAAYQNRKKHPDITFACLMIVTGALGNLYDRLAYGFTVDYIILFGRSAINLSDMVIVSGTVALLMSSRQTQPHPHTH